MGVGVDGVSLTFVHSVVRFIWFSSACLSFHLPHLRQTKDAVNLTLKSVIHLHLTRESTMQPNAIVFTASFTHVSASPFFLPSAGR